MTTAFSTTFTTAVRVINRIHRSTANMRTSPQPSLSPSFAEHNIHVVRVADLTDRRLARRRDTPNLTAWQRDLCPISFTSHQRRTCSSTAAKHATATSLQLDIMNRSSKRNILERQRVPNRRGRLWARHHRVASLQSVGSNDISLFAISVVKQRDPSTAIRIVLNRVHTRGNTVFVSQKVNNPIATLMTAASMASRRAPLIVATASLLDRAQQRLLGLCPGSQIRPVTYRRVATTSRRWFVFSNTHFVTFVGLLSRPVRSSPINHQKKSMRSSSPKVTIAFFQFFVRP